jgi:hypothetical protein
MGKKNQSLIQIGEEFIEVFPEGEKFEKGFGYIHGDYVYIYRGKSKKHDVLQPGSVYLDGDKPLWVEPDDPESHSVSNVFTYNLDNIMKEIEEGNLKEVDPALLEMSSSIFAPAIDPKDDILKKLVKEVLAMKKVSIKASKEYKNAYDITNLKSGLSKPANLTFKYFQKWVEILDLDVTINVKFKDSEGNDCEIERNMK